MILLLAGCADLPLQTLADPPTWWTRNGWVRVTPAARLPSGAEGHESTEIWVLLPEGELLRTATTEDGRPSLVFPAGSSADRVSFAGEGAGRKVSDVRGATLLADGTRSYHVYQPIARDPHAALVGGEWPAGDAAASDALLDRFVDEVRPHRRNPDVWEESYRSKHGCDGCHTVGRPDNRVPGEHGLVNRGTDLQGWFTPSTLLSRQIPGESYGEWHGDRADPFAHPSCPEARQRKVCDDGTVPTWTLDVAAGKAASDPHTLAHCDSIAWLAEHLDPTDPYRGELADHACLSEAKPQE